MILKKGKISIRKYYFKNNKVYLKKNMSKLILEIEENSFIT